jgi:predicted SnoaL-like aldol condensation-catalyzing enzyme
MGTAENKGIVRRIYEDAINNHDLDLLDNYILPDYVNHKNPGGLEGVKQLFVMLFVAFPDLRVSVDSIGADGDRCGYGPPCAAPSRDRSWGCRQAAGRLRPRP